MSDANRAFDPFPAGARRSVDPIDCQRYAWSQPFESGHLRADCTIAILMFAAAAEIGNAVLNYQASHRGGIGPTRTANFVFPEVVAELFLFASIIAFAIWTHRVYRNLPALGARELRHTPGWAVAWLFIPPANLVIPYFVFREIWRASLPIRSDVNGPATKSRTPLLIVGWWTLNILPVAAIVVGAAIVVYSDFTTGADIWRSIDRLDAQLQHVNGLLVPPLAAAAAILAIVVVRQIDKNQQVRFAQLQKAPSQ